DRRGDRGGAAVVRLLGGGGGSAVGGAVAAELKAGAARGPGGGGRAWGGGRLSFAFLEAAPFRRWAVRSGPTYRQVSQEAGVPLETLGVVLEAMGFARVGPEGPMGGGRVAGVPGA